MVEAEALHSDQVKSGLGSTPIAKYRYADEHTRVPRRLDVHPAGGPCSVGAHNCPD